MIRTPREWDETCRACSGTGTVHKRESFALWTPDEYAKAMGPSYGPPKLDSRHDVPADTIVCEVAGGASIFETCKEGVALAQAFDHPVAFEFNDVVAVCRADDDPKDVAERWWKLAYGKTYKQSAASR